MDLHVYFKGSFCFILRNFQTMNLKWRNERQTPRLSVSAFSLCWTCFLPLSEFLIGWQLPLSETRHMRSPLLEHPPTLTVPSWSKDWFYCSLCAILCFSSTASCSAFLSALQQQHVSMVVIINLFRATVIRSAFCSAHLSNQCHTHSINQ